MPTKSAVSLLREREGTGKKVVPKTAKVITELVRPELARKRERDTLVRRRNAIIRGTMLPEDWEDQLREIDDRLAQLQIPEYKKGGEIKKTGLAKLHKGEVVIAANRVKAVEGALKKAGLKPLKK